MWSLLIGVVLTVRGNIMAKRTGFPTRVRNLINKRAQHRCEICGIRKRDMQIHHRKPRGMGGTSDERVNEPSNGLLLCASCHGFVESSRGDAYRMGWLVRGEGLPPLVPARRWDGWKWLARDGAARDVSEDYWASRHPRRVADG